MCVCERESERGRDREREGMKITKISRCRPRVSEGVCMREREREKG